MRSLDVKEITKAGAHVSIETNRHLSPDMEQAFQKAKKQEPWPLARDTLDKIEENIQAAQDMGLAICQDTGMACVFLEIGQDVHLTGGSLQDAVNEGVRQ